jgi:phosphatidylinositol glycan class C protein
VSILFYRFNSPFCQVSLNRSSFPPTLSTNLAIAAATVLASRLSTTLSVFSFLLFSIELFGLFPIFSRWLRSYSFVAHLILTSILAVVTEVGMFYIGGWWALSVWSVAILSAVFVAPGWLIALQKYKKYVLFLLLGLGHALTVSF